MRRMIQTLAIGAALAAVAVGVWRDYGALLTLKRAAVAYLAVYFVAGAIYLAAAAALRAVRDKPPPEESDGRQSARRRKHDRKSEKRSQDARASLPEEAIETSRDRAAAESEAIEAGHVGVSAESDIA